MFDIDMVKMCGATPVIIPTTPEENYTLSPKKLREVLSTHPKITCIILCNPSNPTGCVASKSELEAIVEVLNDFPQVNHSINHYQSKNY